MHKLWFLITYTLKKRIKSKAFIISNIIVALLIILICNIPSIIKAFSSDENAYPVIYLYDNTQAKKASSYILQHNDSQATGIEFETRNNYSSSEEFILSNLESAMALCVLTDFENTFRAQIIAYDIAITNQITLENLLNKAKTDIFLETADEELKENINDYLAPVNVDFQIKATDESSILRSILGIAGIVFMLPVFCMLIMLMQYVGADIIEEKASRSIEIIISNVKPTVHFSSKIIGAILFLIIQISLMAIYGGIGIGILALTGSLTGGGGSMIDINQISSIIEISPTIINSLLGKLDDLIIVGLIFIILGFLLYLLLIAITAAMSSSQEDFQQFQTPLMLVILVGFYVSIFGVQFEGSGFIKVMGYIPFFSPLVAPCLFLTGEFTIANTVVSAIILLAFVLLVIYFGIPLYKSSILSFSQEKFFKRVKSFLKKSNE